MIARPAITKQIENALIRSRVVALVGPRQSGKTTLARQFVAPDSINYFDLEDPLSLARLDEPMTALRDLRGLVVIDEVQRRPDLYPVLRVLADRDPLPARFLILGSAAPQFLRQPSESLAGRLETITISGFSLGEAGAQSLEPHWLRGGFPPAYLAASDADSFTWRQAFMQTLLEHDLPLLGVGAATAMLRRYWAMLAHYHGQMWNAAELARSLDISETTARRYLELLEGFFLVRVLRPWHANLRKRQVKAPKVYFRDSGLLHALLGIRTQKDLLTHPRHGASWEGYAIEETLRAVQPDEAYFWATHAGAELDLLLLKDGHRIGVEYKRVDAPRLTASMRIALPDLELERLLIIYPGPRRYSLADSVEVVPLAELAAGRTRLMP
jgi:predicted AAA+ superfamily ATPase